jgi:hypothetical protein
MLYRVFHNWSDIHQGLMQEVILSKTILIQQLSYFQLLQNYGHFMMYKQQMPTRVYWWQHWWQFQLKMSPLPILSCFLCQLSVGSDPRWVSLETRHRILFQQNGAPPCLGHQVMAYLNLCYENCWIGQHSPITWPPRSLAITMLDYFLWGLMKEMTYRTKVHTREELLHQIMDAAAYIR